ncbi:MAG: tetratricopeptide repeat protein [Cyanobacteria bacterium SZAS-4]|nr:tetratricopeptide repeat protein [Cyanobacteria bacterium SZAS-4]
MQIFPKLRTALTLLGLTASIGLTSGSLAASANTTDAPGLRSIAFEHYLSGDTEAALDYYQKAIDSASREYGAESSYIGQLYYEMGTLALDAKKFVRSEAYLQKAVQHNPNSIMARVKFAELLQLRGKNDEALVQIHAALSKHSSSPEAREALVLWLQSNHKTARAIHESYNISVAAAGNTVAPPVVTGVAAKPDTPKTDTALIASATPAPTPTPPASAAKVPLKIFPWMQPEKKPEPKKVEPEKKPEKKEEKKPVETKKPEKSEKKPKKEPKQQKPAKEKHTKQPKQQPQVEVAQDEMHASAAALRTTAKTIPKKKDKSGDDPAESGGTEEAAAPPAKVKHVAAAPAPAMQAAPTMVFGVPAVKSSKRPQGMVPPPPPMVPVFGNPMGMFQPPPPVFQKPAAPKATAKKPKAAAPAVAKEPAPETKPAASSSGGDEPDPNFLLEWGGANAKKKGK